jgi:NAD(P)-dependent dehydrogenase (short-subunit alcohol dehydrogenase family)
MGTNLESTYALCQLFQPLLAAGAAGGPQALQQQQQQQQQGGPPVAQLDPISRAKAAPTGDACIIFISSVAGGPLAGRSGSLYAASKAALNQLAASFACEWAGQGIRVNSVAPWVTLTELGQQVGGWVGGWVQAAIILCAVDTVFALAFQQAEYCNKACSLPRGACCGHITASVAEAAMD